MDRVKELNREHGKRYLFRKYWSDRQSMKLKASPPDDFPDTVAASLEIGCVRLDAVLFRSDAGIELAYDVLVRETPDHLEWICYDTLPANGIGEPEMAETLDGYVRSHGLDYSNCNFARLEGKEIKWAMK